MDDELAEVIGMLVLVVVAMCAAIWVISPSSEGPPASSTTTTTTTQGYELHWEWITSDGESVQVACDPWGRKLYKTGDGLVAVPNAPECPTSTTMGLR